MKNLMLVLLVLSVLTSCSYGIGDNSPAAHIVCVGLDYKNSTVSTLPGTIADATEVCACLESIYRAKDVKCESVLMLDEGENQDISDPLYPTSSNIQAVLSSLRPSATDLVVFYWSGHGHRDEKGMFLAAAAENGAAYTRLYARDLLDWAQNMPCSTVIVLDSCYSGSAVSSMSGSSGEAPSFLQSLRTLTEETEMTNVCVLAACDQDSLSYVTSVPGEEGPVRAHSVFTASLLEVLGWVCSTENTTEVHGRSAGGYLASLPSRTNTLVLTELVRRDMRRNFDSEKQAPQTTGTAFPVFLVP